MPGSTVTTLPTASVCRDSWAQARILVHEQADAVPEPVPERVAEAGRLDLVARSRVDAGPGRSGPNRFEARQLCVETDLVGAHQLVGQRAGGKRARAVGGVAVDHAAPVDDHGLASLETPLAGDGMRLGRIRPRCDEDGERHAVGACVVQELLHPPGELGLGSADEVAFVDEALERDVRDLRPPCGSNPARPRP